MRRTLTGPGATRPIGSDFVTHRHRSGLVTPVVEGTCGSGEPGETGSYPVSLVLAVTTGAGGGVMGAENS